VLDTACARVAIGQTALPLAVEQADRRLASIAQERSMLVRERHAFQPGAAVRLKPQLTYLFDPSSGARLA